MTLQYQLRNKLIERIGKDWQVGARIASEREICEQYGVSRITVREVVGGLERDGFLTRKQGKGTFVNGGVSEPEQRDIYRFVDTLRGMGLKVTSRVLEYLIVPAKPPEARELGISPGERVHRIERLRSVEGALFSLETSYVPVSVAPGMNELVVKERGLAAAINAHSGLSPDSALETIEAVSCPAKASMMIGIKRDSPVLRVCRVTKCDGRGMELCESIIKSDRFKYTVELG
jgi:GntR family transcriptional regulator